MQFQRRDSFISDFHNNFSHLKNVPIVLYGIGQFTRRIVEQTEGFRIIGLMDSKTTGRKIYGLKVLSEEEVASAAGAVIIVSNLSVAGTIYQRIARLTQEKRIEVYYLNGLQPQIYDTTIAAMPYWSKSEDGLKERILDNEVISFDIFDTLLIRRCRLPEDVFRLAAYAAVGECAGEDFACKRKEAEKTCYRSVTKYFRIEQIYDIMRKEGVLLGDNLSEMMQKEIETEKRLLVPRKAICGLLGFAREHGKTVILTSDMYLGKDTLKEILEENSICEYDRLLISCEEKRDKYWGSMWERVSELYPGKKVLHIGDNEISDEKTPREHGIETYRIAGAGELLKISGIGQHIKAAAAKGDCLVFGMFAARAFNHPLGMGETKGKLYIPNMYEFGYLFLGPLLLKYILWLIRIVQEQQIDTILFVARDGYLPEKLYRKIARRKRADVPKSIYYLSSRRAASVACIEAEEDIWFIFDKVCSTASVKYKMILEKAFGIQGDEGDRYLDLTLYEAGKEELYRHTVEKYGRRILENARQERINYMKYLDRLPLGEKPGFVNFVCRGVTQYCTSKLMKKRIQGFYFASEEDIQDIYPYEEDIFCLYGENLSTHTSRLNLVTKYLYGEAILSAPEGQLICFSEDGRPIYGERADFSGVEECHRGIEQYVDDMLDISADLTDKFFSNELIDQIFGMFDAENVTLAKEVKNTFCFEDYYGL